MWTKEKNKKYQKQYQKVWRIENRDKCREYCRKWRATNKDYFKLYDEMHPEQLALRQLKHGQKLKFLVVKHYSEGSMEWGK